MLNFGKKNGFKKIKKCDIIYSNRIREELKKKTDCKNRAKDFKKIIQKFVIKKRYMLFEFVFFDVCGFQFVVEIFY